MFPVKDAFSGLNFLTTNTITNKESDGQCLNDHVEITIKNTDPNLIGDLRGVFFSLNPDDAGFLGGLTMHIVAAFDQDDRAVNTDNFVYEEDNCSNKGIDRVAQDVIMKGQKFIEGKKRLYNCGLEVSWVCTELRWLLFSYLFRL